MDAETAEQMMEATYRALREHGYADLTMQRIADESSVSKATFHYHFDTKEELLKAFLDHLVEQFEGRLASEAGDPRERLDAFLDAIFAPAEDVSPIPLMELKSQAPYHEAYRERFVEMDERLREVVAEAVRDGIESGQFDDANPEAVARFVVTAINGAHVREVALGETPSETRRMVERYLERELGHTTGVVA
ncbi:TetR/AcrR family transcriptional regulator [Halorussus gelatinilyticus]|uniref:TetR/AcrR family transcriptional regulator n=1 Tax=Halorussus gelatinilyticus TaxID=2937524 RepID=A0A8U0IJQ3_9EURY|nr:TetR/AcrR family transcriptional regulator [Halorussus gelatinilyticus]UPW00522.1 TetR/AcrR family transcriptional regulator [Halorussus gelatinilyticus]